MQSEKFIEILNADRIGEKDLAFLEELEARYPYFNLPRFLLLKALREAGGSDADDRLQEAAIYSGDRKHLYQWVYDTLDDQRISSRPELEFLAEENEEDSEGTSFEFIEEDTDEEKEEEKGEDMGAINEKEEADLEIPDVDESSPVPVMDPIDDLEDEQEDPIEEGMAELEPKAVAPDVPEEPAQEAREAISNKPLLPNAESASDPQNSPQPTGITNKSSEIIERFLQTEPGVIKADKTTQLEGDVSQDSVKDSDSFITDTLAKIYVKQGLHAKAIYAYERLSLKYPEKSAYFAAQIEKIKNN